MGADGDPPLPQRLSLSKDAVDAAQASPESPLPSSKRIQRRYTLPDMLGLFAMSFCYGLIFQSVVVLVIPTEVQRMIQTKQSVWVSLIMAGGAVSQLGSPIVGAWSDRVHKRVSFLVYGTLTCIVGIGLFLAVKAANSLFLLFVAHTVTMVGLSVLYSMICALLNDCILPEQVGMGSGAIAILGTLGSGCGYALFAVSMPLEYTYLAYIACSVLCLGISVLYIPPNLDSMLKQAAEKIRDRECQQVEPGQDDLEVAKDGLLPERRGSAAGGAGSPRSTLGLLLDAITMPSPSRHPDFMFACLSRLLFNSGLAAQVYMAYYFRDVQHMKSPTQMVSLVAVSTLAGCICAALPAGMLSDRVGKKPVIYTGLLVCVTSVLFFLVTQSKELFLVLGVYYGVGNIAYLSVDYALGVASLPRHDPKVETPTASGSPPALGQPIDAAKDLGIFSMSATLGSVMGQVLYGGLLDIYTTSDSSGATVYQMEGFQLLFTSAAVFFFLSGLSVKWIKCVS